MQKLLIVDDEIEICDFLKAFFEDRDYDVETAHNGEEAVEKAAAWQPQLILMDIQMPKLDGLGALKQIKEKNKAVKVIMVTAVETQDRIEEAMRYGADNYITKPLSLEYLENEVQEKLNSLSS